MQSKSQDTPAGSTWSGPVTVDGQQTDGATTKSPSDPSTTTSSDETPGVGQLSYVTSVAGITVNDEDTEEFIRGLEEWYDNL